MTVGRSSLKDDVLRIDCFCVSVWGCWDWGLGSYCCFLWVFRVGNVAYPDGEDDAEDERNDEDPDDCVEHHGFFRDDGCEEEE
jgi:hypothetical protein